MSNYRSKIKTCLQIITQSIKQIPQDKQAIIASRVNKVLEKYSKQQSKQTEEHLRKFNKELEFNLNFINMEQEKPVVGVKQQENQEKRKERPFPTEAGKIHEQFQLDNAQALNKEMKDISGVREEVDFSNWSQGNVDPENIKRHKQLLTRQHFGGDFWKGKEIPKMESAKVVAGIMQNMKPPTVTQKDLQKKEKVFAYDPEKAFEKVKR